MAKKKEADKSAQNNDSVKNHKTDTIEDEEPHFDDPEEFVDKITDEGK